MYTVPSFWVKGYGGLQCIHARVTKHAVSEYSNLLRMSDESQSTIFSPFRQYQNKLSDKYLLGYDCIYFYKKEYVHVV